MSLHTVISGGQTGVDQIGLKVAKSLGFTTTGYAPKGFRTEDGPCPELKTKYDLVELLQADYTTRTRRNVLLGSGTVIFGNTGSPGTSQTIAVCEVEQKPYICNPSAEQLRDWVIDKQINILNVAGNRGSKLSTVQIKHITSVLYFALTQILHFQKTQEKFSLF